MHKINTNPPLKNAPILITGCQRSGTTLLSLILDSHPKIHSIDEMDFFDHPLIDYLTQTQYHPNVCFKLPIYADRAVSFTTIPQLKILWCQREPLDVIASMLSLGIRFRDGSIIGWAAHPECAETEIKGACRLLNEYNQLDQLPLTLRQQTQTILNKHPTKRDRADQLVLACMCWRAKQALLPVYDQLHLNYKIVQYEKLVRQSQSTLTEILDYLNIEWSDDVLRHHELHAGLSVGNTNNQRAIDSSSIGKHTDKLNNTERDIILSFC